MPEVILLVLGCATPPADALQAALNAPDPETALALCDGAGDDREECVTTIVRNHPDVTGDAPCAALATTRWRGECHFAYAESRAKAGDRWGALAACGQAEDFYNECLYHAWTFELQLHSENLGRAVDGVEAVRPIIAFWAGIQTIGPDPARQMWRDWWYFAQARNKPASLAACAELTDATDRERCEDGTRTYVRRSIVEAFLRQDGTPLDKDRVCRGDPAVARTLLGDLYVPDPAMDAEAAAALEAACGPTPPERPWNPVFRPRRFGRG